MTDQNQSQVLGKLSPGHQASQTPKSFILHSRARDGLRQVEVLPFGYHVTETNSLYTSRRSLLQSLTQDPTARGWTFDRYFGVGKFADPTFSTISIQEICQGLTLDKRWSGTGLTVMRSNALGIDLKKRSGEVQKLLFAGFGRKIFAAGYDPDDVLQEVFRGILARNIGKCAWDPAKSSFGHYVHMVAGCVLMNFHKKEQRHRSMEQLGVMGDEDELVDVAESEIPTNAEFPMDMGDDLIMYLGRVNDVETELAQRMVPLIRQGMNREEMSRALGVSKVMLGKAYGYLRGKASEWSAQ